MTRIATKITEPRTMSSTIGVVGRKMRVQSITKSVLLAGE